MAETDAYGLTRSQLEYHVRWLMRRAPKDPAKMPQFLTDVFVTLIEKNNEALARSARDAERPDMPEDF